MKFVINYSYKKNYQRNSAEIFSAYSIIIYFNSLSIRSIVIANLEPVILVDATILFPDVIGAATHRTPS
jgi:hypothetical protein